MTSYSKTLLHDTGDFWNFIGNPVRANGWYNLPSAKHTVSLSVINFRGRFILEGTLLVNPSEDDWFRIPLSGNLPWIQFPLDPGNPTGANGGDTRNIFYNIIGNFVWLRGRLERTYLFPNPPSIPHNYGKIIRATVI